MNATVMTVHPHASPAHLSHAHACCVGVPVVTSAMREEDACKRCSPLSHTPPYPPSARVTEGDPRRRAREACAREGVWYRAISAATVPPYAINGLQGPTEQQAIASEFVSRGSRPSPLAHGARHVAPGRAGRARGGRGTTWPTEGTEGKRGGLRRRTRCCSAERSFTHEANCQRDRRSAPPRRGNDRVPVRPRRGRRHQAARVGSIDAGGGLAEARRMEPAQRGADPRARAAHLPRCRALPRDQRALPVGDLVAARPRAMRTDAERRALRPGRPEAGHRALQAHTTNGWNG